MIPSFLSDEYKMQFEFFKIIIQILFYKQRQLLKVNFWLIDSDIMH